MSMGYGIWFIYCILCIVILSSWELTQFPWRNDELFSFTYKGTATSLRVLLSKTCQNSLPNMVSTFYTLLYSWMCTLSSVSKWVWKWWYFSCFCLSRDHFRKRKQEKNCKERNIEFWYENRKPDVFNVFNYLLPSSS